MGSNVSVSYLYDCGIEPLIQKPCFHMIACVAAVALPAKTLLSNSIVSYDASDHMETDIAQYLNCMVVTNFSLRNFVSKMVYHALRLLTEAEEGFFYIFQLEYVQDSNTPPVRV